MITIYSEVNLAIQQFHPCTKFFFDVAWLIRVERSIQENGTSLF